MECGRPSQGIMTLVNLPVTPFHTPSPSLSPSFQSRPIRCCVYPATVRLPCVAMFNFSLSLYLSLSFFLFIFISLVPQPAMQDLELTYRSTPFLVFVYFLSCIVVFFFFFFLQMYTPFRVLAVRYHRYYLLILIIHVNTDRSERVSRKDNGK